jgi:hypothetical protein
MTPKFTAECCFRVPNLLKIIIRVSKVIQHSLMGDIKSCWNSTCILEMGTLILTSETHPIYDIYFDLEGNQIFAKLDLNRWEYWNVTEMRISDLNYPVIEYPFYPKLHLWPKADMGVQWFHKDNFKTQRSRRKGEVVHVRELIQLTLLRNRQLSVEKKRLQDRILRLWEA